MLPCVRQAEQELVGAKLDKEYAGIAGISEFTENAMKLAYGAESNVLTQKRYAVVQAVSGTGLESFSKYSLSNLGRI